MTGDQEHEPSTGPLVRVVESDGNVFELVAHTLAGTLCIITEVAREGDDLVLRKLHADGPGARSLGLRLLREIARDLGRQWGVRRVVVHGAARTTGAFPGRLPRPVIVVVEDS